MWSNTSGENLSQSQGVPPQDQHTGHSTLFSSSSGCIFVAATAADEAAVLVVAVDDAFFATSEAFLLRDLLGSLVALSENTFLFLLGDCQQWPLRMLL